MIQPIPSHNHSTPRAPVAMPAPTRPTIAMDSLTTRGGLLLQVPRQQVVPGRDPAEVVASSRIKNYKPSSEKTFQDRMRLTPASLPKDRRRLEKCPRGGRLDRTPSRGATGSVISRLQPMLHIGMLRQQDRDQEHLSHLAMSCRSCTKTPRLVTPHPSKSDMQESWRLAECFPSGGCACNAIYLDAPCNTHADTSLLGYHAIWRCACSRKPLGARQGSIRCRFSRHVKVLLFISASSSAGPCPSA